MTQAGHPGMRRNTCVWFLVECNRGHVAFAVCSRNLVQFHHQANLFVRFAPECSSPQGVFACTGGRVGIAKG